MKNRCFLVFIVLVAALLLSGCGHEHVSGGWETADAPTCTAPGREVSKCTACGKVTQERQVSPLGHDCRREVTPPTKTEQGYTTFICTRCGERTVGGYIAPVGSAGLAYTVDKESGTCTVTGMGTCTDSHVVIPGVIDGYPVASIGYEAFIGLGGLTEVTVLDGLTAVGESAFRECYELEKVVLAESVVRVGSAAFFGCSGLTEIYLPDSITSLGNCTFMDCRKLKSITIPPKVTVVDIAVFQDCASLTEVTIPDGVTHIGDWAFRYCTSLTRLTVPASVTFVGEDACAGCPSGLAVHFSGTAEQWEKIRGAFPSDVRVIFQ